MADKTPEPQTPDEAADFAADTWLALAFTALQQPDEDRASQVHRVLEERYRFWSIRDIEKPATVGGVDREDVVTRLRLVLNVQDLPGVSNIILAPSFAREVLAALTARPAAGDAK